ncbi:MAG: hypothetical protein ABJA66_16260 [Actinomycetota bacterium]
MKKVTIFITMVFCLAFAGCSNSNKDAEVEAFITVQTAMVSEMIKKIDADPTTDGVDDARKVFDAKKAGVKEKRDALKTVREGQVSPALFKKMNDANDKAVADFQGLKKKYAENFQKSDGALDKYNQLLKDYDSYFGNN